MILYPLVACLCYYFMFHLPMSMGRGKAGKVVYDEKTGRAYVVRNN